MRINSAKRPCTGILSLWPGVMGFGAAMALAGSAFGGEAVWTAATSENWHDPVNWLSQRVPGISDDVTSALPEANIQIYEATTVRSISLPAGSEVAVYGAGATLEVTGAAALNGVGLQAGEGAVINLPGLVSFSPNAPSGGNVMWYAWGEGSRITIPALTSFEGATFPWSMDIFARNGAQVRIGGEFNLISGAVMFEAAGAGAVLELAGLRNAAPSHFVLAANAGGRVSVPNLLEYSAAGVDRETFRWEANGAGSVLDVRGLTNFVGAPGSWSSLLRAEDNGRLTIQGDFKVTSGAVSLVVADAESVLEAPGLTAIHSTRFYAVAARGARLALPGLREWDASGANLDASRWVADGTNSVLELPGLTTFRGPPHPWETQLIAERGGKVVVGGDFEILTGGVAFVAEGGGSVVEVPGLKRLQANASGATASAGGRISLAHLEEFSGANTTWALRNWSSHGPGSLIEIAELKRLEGASISPSATHIYAEDGGKISILGDCELNKGFIQFTAQRGGSVVELPAIKRMAPASMTLRVDGTDGGARMSFPNATEYSGVNARDSLVFTVINAGAVLEMPVLSAVSIPLPFYLSVTAQYGGKVFLPAVPALIGRIYVLADGAGSAMDLRSLARVRTPLYEGNLAAENGGEIHLASVFTEQGPTISGLNSWGGAAITNAPSNQERLYMLPGQAVLVEQGTGPDGPWRVLGRIAGQTNQYELSKVFAPSGAEMRASVLLADPPAMNIHLGSGSNTRLTLFGVPAGTYRIEKSALFDPAIWTTVQDVTLTGSFAQIDLPRTEGQSAYRLRRL